MAIDICTVPGAVFAVWGAPTTADVDKLMLELKGAAAKSGGPVVYVARIPADAPVPPPEVRKYIDKQMDDLKKLCSSYHAVMEGSGFIAALKRGVLMSMQQLAGRSKTFFVHSSAEDVFKKLEPTRKASVTRVFELAKRRDWLPE